ncbi:cupin domain-containing protein [Vibrio sp. CyArs1]|uniref:cupin domain-containing protein n=1 Tax=Vibrio sp. CyArs1 TaxID=2682577 RepID=UPI001F05CC75|nr:cupin domain-containing protein [Vibrio sp. CyArs1]
MGLKRGNIFGEIPKDLTNEVFEDIIASEGVRIERIVSDGHFTPIGDWYDQTENEWVTVLKGEGVIEYYDGTFVTLGVGGYIDIPAHVKHRVKSTSESSLTIWLAVFYPKDESE